MTNSTHRAEVVPVTLEPHPNADTLSIVRVFAGYTVCVRTADWLGREAGAYLPPDSVVDTSRAEFAFLADGPTTRKRIKVKKLRGVPSMGLLVPAPTGLAIGDDAAPALGVEHYEPPQPVSTGGEAAPAPRGYRPRYDVESLRRYAGVLVPGEPLWVTEKIHGANGRWCYSDGELHAGSRTEWKVERDDIIWWKAIRECEALAEWCRHNPEWTAYGEVYGQVQDLKYGVKAGVRVAVFDLLGPDGQWLAPREALAAAPELPWVPTLHAERPATLEELLALAEGPSRIDFADHVREGCVVRPMAERTDPSIGRVCLKIVGNGYMER